MPAAIVMMPARLDAQPVARPRRVLGTVRPSTSFDATEASDRASANTDSRPSRARPAARPCSVSATSPIAMTLTPSSAEAATQTHLRWCQPRTQPAKKICSSIEPASRTGTSRPMIQVGTARAPASQVSVVFGFISASPILVSRWAPM
ncbi:hypothetical protein FU658_00475 [Alkalisalibacterium limincola]|uniref:Uncharacterized protein n=1 Tax=Alkalisalibacterium limincola TaxID=2699169 RepID=A0A5C8KUN3_9GAMM|nr:hypothetical protein [Alkalisalibacterium limincola]TXK65644.1 hypothetical protein FU658_00475 [Alkalisalibacterium limincola]